MKLRGRILAIVLTICVAMSIPLSVVTATPKAEPKATNTAEVLTTSASGDNDHLRLTQTAKWVGKQKTEAEVTFNLETDTQVIGISKNQDIIFVVDQSDSMRDERTEKVEESLKESTTALLGNNLDNRLGLVQFGDNAIVRSELTNDSNAFNTAIENLSLDGLTSYALGLKKAQEMLDARVDKSREAVIIFMSDGGATDTNQGIQTVVNQLKAKNVEIYAVQYLSGLTIQPSIMLVAGEEDRAYNADTLDSISTVYREVISQVIGAKIYTDMKLDIPVDTDNYTIVSGVSNNGTVSVSPDKAIWTASKHITGFSSKITLRLKLKNTALTGYLNNLAQTNLTYTDPDTGKQTVLIDTTVLKRINYTLSFHGNLNTGGSAPDDMTVVGGTEISLPYNPNGLTKDGEVFTGWSLGDVQQKQPFTMPEEDTTLNAVWGNQEIELNTTTFAPAEPVLMAEGAISEKVAGANRATKVEFVDYIDASKTVVDLSATGDKSIGAWMDGDTLYLGCSTNPIPAPVDSSILFSNLTSLRVINFNDWFVTDRVTSMSRMFRNTALSSLDLSSFDTSKVTDMNGMFDQCRSLSNLDLSSFVTSKVTDMNAMFSGCSALTSLDLKNFDTRNVTDMKSMFLNCKGLTILDLKNFDTSKVTDMGSMFNLCGALQSLDLSSFDTSKVTNMNNMFMSCSSLTSVDLSSFDTSNVTNMGSMFYSCRALTSADLSSFDMSNASVNRLFMYANALQTVYVRTEEEKATVQGSGSFPANVTITIGKPTENRSAGLETTPDTTVDGDTEVSDTSVVDNSVAEENKAETASLETDTSVETNSAVTEEKTDEATTASEKASEEALEETTASEKASEEALEETTGGVAPMAMKPTATSRATKAVAKVNTRAVVDSTLIDGGKIEQNDVVNYEITVKYHAAAVSQSNRIKVTNKMPEGMIYLADSVTADVVATRIEENDGGKLLGKIENLKVENNVVTFDVVGLSAGAKMRVGYKTTATKDNDGSYYEFLNQAGGTLQGLRKDSNFVKHHYNAPPAQQYTLTYDYALGSPVGAPAVPTPKDYVEGQVINLPTPSMPGYTFDGWKVNDVAVTSPYTMPVENITLIGSWTQIAVTDTDIIANVTYEFDGDIPAGMTPPPSGSYTVGTNAGGTEDIWGVTVDIPTITAPDGYTFGGWTSDKVSADDIANGSFTLEESVVIKGTWAKNKYKVTYQYGGDTPVDAPELPTEATYEWGATVSTAEAPQDTATANFEGWMSDNNIGSDFATSFTMPQEDVVLFGYWTKAADFKVTYQYDDTKPKPADAPTLSEDKGNEGNTKIAHAPTSTEIRDGNGNYGTWTLDKWTSPDITGDVVAGETYTMPNKDITLTGAWTFNIDQDYREVKFKIENGKWADGTTDEIIVPIKLVGGVATLDSADVPTGMNANTGYGLGEWDVTPNTDADAVTDHVTYTYKYKKVEQKMVTFKIIGGNWADNTDTDKTVEVTLVDGKGTLDTADVPTGMTVKEGYEGTGKWDVTPNTDTNAVMDDVTYTYEFTKTAVSDPSSGSDITVSGTTSNGGNTPSTGDNNMFAILFSLVGISLTAIVVVATKARRQKNRR